MHQNNKEKTMAYKEEKKDIFFLHILFYVRSCRHIDAQLPKHNSNNPNFALAL